LDDTVMKTVLIGWYSYDDCFDWMVQLWWLFWLDDNGDFWLDDTII